jgi:L-seryl-tRNA(Ser) seleniumtransferase
MSSPFWERVRLSLAGCNRRELFRGGSLLAAAQALAGGLARLAAAPLELGGNLYRSIGVRPVINARGTFTIITGSQTLPEVKRAMDDASRHYVQMDELMDGVGQRLAELTGAEWGIVTAGCAAAMTHATAAAIAGNNPERMQRLPELAGLKSEVIIPGYSRNVYDHAIRMLGVKIVEVHNAAELEPAFNERTAMVYILAGPGDDGPLGTRVVAEVAKRKGVPLLVDAAAEILTVKPNVHLERGATAVAYSGGKCIRGPQAAGILLGEKAWLQAAWLNSAPHHAFGRSLKVGKEEIMGMLAAVEQWVKRDHQAEWRQWEAWLETIAASVRTVGGVTAEIAQPGPGLSNRSPRLTIRWDGARLGISGQELAKAALDGEPRIVVAGATGSRTGELSSSVSLIPYMMMPGEEKLVGDRLRALLANPPKAPVEPQPEGPPASVAGQWEARLEFGRASANHLIVLEQDGARLVGTHRGEFYSGDLSGTVAGNQVRFRSSHRVHGTRLSYEFTGTLANTGRPPGPPSVTSTGRRAGAGKASPPESADMTIGAARRPGWLESVFDSAPVAMLVVDEAGRIVDINRAGRALAGKPKDSVLGLLTGPAAECVNSTGPGGCGRGPRCSMCPLRSRVEWTARTGEPVYDAEGRFTIVRDGKPLVLDFLVSTAPLLDGDRRLVLVTLTDKIARMEEPAGEPALVPEQRASAVFHHQAGGQGNGIGFVQRLWHRPAERRTHPDGKRARQGHDGPDVVSARGRREGGGPRRRAGFPGVPARRRNHPAGRRPGGCSHPGGADSSLQRIHRAGSLRRRRGLAIVRGLRPADRPPADRRGDAESRRAGDHPGDAAGVSHRQDHRQVGRLWRPVPAAGAVPGGGCDPGQAHRAGSAHRSGSAAGAGEPPGIAPRSGCPVSDTPSRQRDAG